METATLKWKQKTPVLDKVQGRMAGVLKEENWPNPRKREVMERQRVGEIREKRFVVEVSVHWGEC